MRWSDELVFLNSSGFWNNEFKRSSILFWLGTGPWIRIVPGLSSESEGAISIGGSGVVRRDKGGVDALDVVEDDVLCEGTWNVFGRLGRGFCIVVCSCSSASSDGDLGCLAKKFANRS